MAVVVAAVVAAAGPEDAEGRSAAAPTVDGVASADPKATCRVVAATAVATEAVAAASTRIEQRVAAELDRVSPSRWPHLRCHCRVDRFDCYLLVSDSDERLLQRRWVELRGLQTGFGGIIRTLLLQEMSILIMGLRFRDLTGWPAGQNVKGHGER